MKYPIRQDIEVLPADDTSKIKLGWTVKEYMGCEVYKKSDYKEPIHNEGEFSFVNENIINRLLNKNDLQEGDEIVCYGSLYLVKKNKDGKLYGEGGNHIVVLEFNVDDRKCWTCGAVINMRCIAMVNKIL